MFHIKCGRNLGLSVPSAMSTPPASPSPRTTLLPPPFCRSNSANATQYGDVVVEHRQWLRRRRQQQTLPHTFINMIWRRRTRLWTWGVTKSEANNIKETQRNIVGKANASFHSRWPAHTHRENHARQLTRGG